MSELEQEMQTYFKRLWPICRSITGNGLRDSLQVINEIVPLDLYEVASGTEVFDWKIPLEWNIEDAWIECPDGQKICKFKENNLHVINYSNPIDTALSWEELEPHLRTVKHLPEAIPYITSYYKDQWGFCLTQRQKDSLPRNGLYRVVIKSEKKPGSLTYGEAVLPGTTDRELLFSTYLCHPSMAINELSGPLVTAFLYKALAAIPNRKYTLRFVFAPETIGVIAYLNRIGKHLSEKLDAGYVITCVGHEGQYTYKRSRRGNSLADRAAEHVLKYSNTDAEIINFAIGGSDERQYCAPGWNFPVGSLMRTMYKRYPEYHTSLDNESIMSYTALAETVDKYVDIVKALELNETPDAKVKFCEPQLGKRNLYAHSGAWLTDSRNVHDLLHLLAHADGQSDLFTIAEKREKCILEFANALHTARQSQLI